MSEAKKKTTCPLTKKENCEGCKWYRMRVTGYMKCHIEEMADCLSYVAAFTGTGK